MEMVFDWPEFFAIVFMIIGFGLALFSDNLIIAYIVVFLMGLLFCRVWYRGKKTNQIPLFLSIVFFLLGFMIGTLFASLQIIVLLMLAGVILGFWLHEKGIIHSVEY